MTDREKLVELLEAAESAVYWNSGDKSFIEKIADHMIANGVTMNRWRDAKTEPPEKWKDDDGNLTNYLVFCPQYGVDVGNYVEPAKRWVVVGIPAPVTHWMPLLEPPKKEENSNE